jgi:hypothetical protein
MIINFIAIVVNFKGRNCLDDVFDDIPTLVAVQDTRGGNQATTLKVRRPTIGAFWLQLRPRATFQFSPTVEHLDVMVGANEPGKPASIQRTQDKTDCATNLAQLIPYGKTGGPVPVNNCTFTFKLGQSQREFLELKNFQLGRKYTLDHFGSISYALAVDTA